MQDQIFGYTEPSEAPYPAYVAIRKVQDGISIAVRSAGVEQVSEVQLSMGNCSDMVSALVGDTPIGLITAQLKGLAGLARSFVSMLNYSEFEFELGQTVRIPMTGEEGYIRARAEYQHKEPDYLVYYKAVDGTAGNEWLAESLLDAVVDAVVDADELPTDAEIPMGPAGNDVATEWKKVDQWSPVQDEAAR